MHGANRAQERCRRPRRLRYSPGGVCVTDEEAEGWDAPVAGGAAPSGRGTVVPSSPFPSLTQSVSSGEQGEPSCCSCRRTVSKSCSAAAAIVAASSMSGNAGSSVEAVRSPLRNTSQSTATVPSTAHAKNIENGFMAICRGLACCWLRQGRREWPRSPAGRLDL